MRRIALLALVAAAVAVPVAAEAAAPVKHYAQPGTLGFYRGQTIEYLDLGPVKLAPGNTTAPIWVVANGHDAQLNVVDTVPGRRDYSPLWAVRMVTWKDGVAPRLLTSAAAIRRAAARGDVTIQSAPVVVKLPGALRRAGGRAPPAPDSRPGQPAAGTGSSVSCRIRPATFARHQ